MTTDSDSTRTGSPWWRARSPIRASADDVAVLSSVAKATGLHLGEHVPLGVYTNAQTQLPSSARPASSPYRKAERHHRRLVVSTHNLVEDDVDNSGSLAYSPRRSPGPLLACCANYTETGCRSRRHRHLAAVDAEIQRLLPEGLPRSPARLSHRLAKAERAIKPESIALGVFGGIAALAALLIAAQVIGRQTPLGDRRRCGRCGRWAPSPAMTTADGLIGVLGAVVIGVLLAVAVAVLLSPLAPIGPVRPVDPTPGVSFDWTVLGLGFLVLVVRPRRRRRSPWPTAGTPRRGADERPSCAGATVGRGRQRVPSGLPAPAVTGVALRPRARCRSRRRAGALGHPRGRARRHRGGHHAHVRRQPQHARCRTPRLYGWNWDSILDRRGRLGRHPPAPGDRAPGPRPLRPRGPARTPTTSTSTARPCPSSASVPDAAVQPADPVAGPGSSAPDQVVLGAITLAQLHKHLGDTVSVEQRERATDTTCRSWARPPCRPSAAPGPISRWGPARCSPTTSSRPPPGTSSTIPITGPEDDLREPPARRRPPRRPFAATDRQISSTQQLQLRRVSSDPVLRPAEIVNYRSMGTTPALLGAALAAGAVVALGLTLVASVRRRRRDLALLKTLGFTRRQLASVVAWQSSVAVTIGTVVGIPLGIVLGRFLWTCSPARSTPCRRRRVPALSIVLIAVGALVLANLVAAVPGESPPARRPRSSCARSEIPASHLALREAVSVPRTVPQDRLDAATRAIVPRHLP